MRPFFPYYGSKWNIARHYPPPTHETVIEPFAGAAGYATFHTARSAVLLDADPVICGVWDYLLRVSAAEIQALPDLPAVGDSVHDFPLPQEAKWLIGFWLNRGSAIPKISRTAYSARTDKGQLNWGPRAKARIVDQLDGLTGWTVRHGSYTDLPNQDGTWFIDPPYGDKGKFYRVGFSAYHELGDWAQSRSGQVIVCEGPGADWLPFTELGSYKSSTGRATELVWTRPDS